MQHTSSQRILTIVAVTLVFATSGVASGPASHATMLEYDFHSVVPMGVDALHLEPANKTVYLVVSAESPQFEGLKRFDDGHQVTVTGVDGEVVADYPETVDFRITASTRKKMLSDAQGDMVPYPVKADASLNDYLLGLTFQLKIFHGIQMRIVEPTDVKLVGVPGDVPYNERIYRASFKIGRVPLEDRMKLEVLDPSGSQVSKFPLEVY